MAIILTETAAEEIKRYREAQKVEAGPMLRMGVAGGGCSGLQYTLGFETDFDPQVDAQYEQHGVAIVTTKKMALHLDGTTIDFLDGPMGRGFSIDNPNVPAAAAAPAADTISWAKRPRPSGHVAFGGGANTVSQSDRQQHEVYYAGSVQGVGFRYTVRSLASRFEVTGFVRNLPDGRVHSGCRGRGRRSGRFPRCREGGNATLHQRRRRKPFVPLRADFEDLKFVIRGS